jgi:hypothetical protein
LFVSEGIRSHNSASPVALLRASFFLSAGADDGAEDLALGAVAVGLQQLDVAIDEDALALLESVNNLVSIVIASVKREQSSLTFRSSTGQRKYPASRKQKACTPCRPS